MDYIILSRNSIFEITKVTQLLDKTFKVKALGNLKLFLGLEIARTKDDIHVSQHKYALDVISDAGLLVVKPCSTLIIKGMKNIFNEGNPLEDITSYQRLIERLIYLTNKRPDISYVMQFFSQFMHAPTLEHHIATHRVLRYIKGAPEQGLFFPSHSNLQLKGFCDSEWATCPSTRRSTTGFCVFLDSSF